MLPLTHLSAEYPSNPATLPRSLAVPDPVDDDGMTPLCSACLLGNAQVATALLDAAADMNFTPPPTRTEFPSFTPLMLAAVANCAGIVKLLVERGADGTKRTTAASPFTMNMLYAQSFSNMQFVPAIDAGSTALDIARTLADTSANFARTLAVLRQMCCSTCGVTSAGLPATEAGVERRLKHCARCPADGTRAHYCGAECQRADWEARHRGECAAAARQDYTAVRDSLEWRQHSLAGERHAERATDSREGGRLHGHCDEPGTGGVVLLNLGACDFFLDTNDHQAAGTEV